MSPLACAKLRALFLSRFGVRTGFPLLQGIHLCVLDKSQKLLSSSITKMTDNLLTHVVQTYTSG